MNQLKEMLEAYRNGERGLPTYDELAELVDSNDKEIRNQAREEAAVICDEIASDLRDAYKGRGKYEPMNPRRADTHVDGQSDGADQCADAIRALIEVRQGE